MRPTRAPLFAWLLALTLMLQGLSAFAMQSCLHWYAQAQVPAQTQVLCEGHACAVHAPSSIAPSTGHAGHVATAQDATDLGVAAEAPCTQCAASCAAPCLPGMVTVWGVDTGRSSPAPAPLLPAPSFLPSPPERPPRALVA